MAWEIQNSEGSKWKKIFVNMGQFHTQMAYFKALGKFIDGSGISEILVQADVLAGGSMNSFLDGKHFNRCKRIHPLTTSAIYMLHIERFLSESDINVDSLIHDLELAQGTEVDMNKSFQPTCLLREVVDEYKNYCLDTLAGKYGKTAQYYLQYAELVSVFLRFSRSIRCSDMNLYIFSIDEMCNLFFALNQPNYARWTVYYLSQLVGLKLNNSHLVEEFKRGAFGVKRTNSKLARSPVDLTLEQTINADAANTLKGISHFTNSVSARQRWALSHAMRTKILSSIYQMVGLTSSDDTSYALQKSRIEKDQNHLECIISVIEKSINPFAPNIEKDVLFNISTGRAASPEVAEFLLNVVSIGENQKLTFMNNVCTIPGSFEKPIKRNVIHNFVSQCAKKKVASRDGGKTALLKMERDVFGRLLGIAVEKKVDIEFFLNFPLAPVPPALFQYSGEMHRTEKASLAKLLRSRVKTACPPPVDVDVIDGFFFLHQLGTTLPQTLGKLAESILQKVCYTSSKEIHLIFDRYFQPSIKDLQRQSRNEFDVPFTIHGPLQPRPNDFIGCLKNFRFKESFVQFLATHWAGNEMAHILHDKKVFMTVDNQCFSFSISNNRVIKKVEDNYECQHEEADTRIMFHISKLAPNSKVLVKASDTDVLIILLGNLHKAPGVNVWLTSPKSQKISRNYDQDCIDCSKLVSILGPKLCSALPAYHAFTGCDYTSSFFNRGKVRPFKILENNIHFQQVFASLTDPADIFDDDKIEAVQEFTCKMYNVQNCDSVNNARFQIFQRIYGRSKVNEKFMRKIKGFDSNTIPPCWKSLKQKILRTVYVNSMWINATEPCCVKFSAEDCGWFNENGVFKPRWFVGDSIPLDVDDVLRISDRNSEENANDSDIEISSSDESSYE